MHPHRRHTPITFKHCRGVSGNVAAIGPEASESGEPTQGTQRHAEEKLKLLKTAQKSLISRSVPGRLYCTRKGTRVLCVCVFFWSMFYCMEANPEIRIP